MTQVIVISPEELETLIERSVRKVLSEQAHRTEHSERDAILSIDQCAAFLKLTKPTIYSYTSKNIIPFMKKGKRLYFRQSDLEKWLLQGKHKSISEMTIEFNNNRNLRVKK